MFFYKQYDYLLNRDVKNNFNSLSGNLLDANHIISLSIFLNKISIGCQNCETIILINIFFPRSRHAKDVLFLDYTGIKLAKFSPWTKDFNKVIGAMRAGSK